MQVRFSPLAAKTWASWGFSKNAVIAASSATDVWVFGGVRAIRYARYNGHGWAFGTVPGTTLAKRPKALTIMSTAVVLSPTDAWVFGLRLATGAPGTVTPYAAQFTVHGWVTRTVPGAGSIAAVTAVSPRDILARVDRLGES